jgi:hypothetical protein
MLTFASEIKKEGIIKSVSSVGQSRKLISSRSGVQAPHGLLRIKI